MENIQGEELPIDRTEFDLLTDNHFFRLPFLAESSAFIPQILAKIYENQIILNKSFPFVF